MSSVESRTEKADRAAQVMEHVTVSVRDLHLVLQVLQDTDIDEQLEDGEEAAYTRLWAALPSSYGDKPERPYLPEYFSITLKLAPVNLAQVLQLRAAVRRDVNDDDLYDQIISDNGYVPDDEVGEEPTPLDAMICGIHGQYIGIGCCKNEEDNS